MIFGDFMGLKVPDIRLTGEENPEKITQESCPDRGSNPGPLCDSHACYRLLHSGGHTHTHTHTYTHTYIYTGCKKIPYTNFEGL